MAPQSDEARVEACLGLFGDSAKILHKIGARFGSNIPQAQKLFWKHPMKFLGDMSYVESHFFLIGDSVTVGAR
jgi:hypothetical protein